MNTNNNNSKTTTSSSEQRWTDEKHSSFLNSMEASFVRTMFENKSRFVRLDRYLPDTSDSTLDSKSNKLDNVNSSAPKGRSNMDGGSEKTSRRRVKSQSSNSSQDQVVPQMENRNAGDKCEKE